MERIEKTVFLSYRRTNVSWALLISRDLTQHGYDVFFDYTGIGSGDFERVIVENITARAHFLVLLTPTALERCDDPADLLRREIETALANQRNIVPLMLEGFDFGTPKIAGQLTGTLAALKRYNGLPVPPDYFEAAMGRLRRFLNVPLAAVLHPASLPAQRAATEQKAAANAIPAVNITSYVVSVKAFKLVEEVTRYLENNKLPPARRLPPALLAYGPIPWDQTPEATMARAYKDVFGDRLKALVAQFKEVGIILPQKDEAYFDPGMYSWVPLTISQIKDAANRLANDLESTKKAAES